MNPKDWADEMATFIRSMIQDSVMPAHQIDEYLANVLRALPSADPAMKLGLAKWLNDGKEPRA